MLRVYYIVIIMFVLKIHMSHPIHLLTEFERPWPFKNPLITPLSKGHERSIKIRINVDQTLMTQIINYYNYLLL